MLSEIVFLVAIAHVWARGSLFSRARQLWPALLDCPLCSGFWIGVLGHLAFAMAPQAMLVLGVGALTGTLSLAVYGLIRRI